jgi:hypothetical protein
VRAFRRTHRHLYRSSKQGVLRIIAKRHRLSKRVALWDITYDHVCRAKLTQEDLEEYQWLILRALSALSAEIGISFTAGVPGPDGSTGFLWLFRPGREPRQTNDREPPPGETSVSFLVKEES